MPKKHKFFPPSLYKVAGAWAAIATLVLGAWAVPQFRKNFYINFPASIEFIVLLFILNLIYLIHSCFDDFQGANNELNDLAVQYKTLIDKNEKFSKKCDLLEKRNDKLSNNYNQLLEKFNKLKKTHHQYNNSTIMSENIVDTFVNASKSTSTITETTTHTIVINNKGIEEPPKNNKPKITNKES